MKIVIVGTGLMGAQIGCEYALGGHDVACVARRAEEARERIERGFALAEAAGIWSPTEIGAGRARLELVDSLEWLDSPADLVLESVPEDLETKVEVLGRVVRRWPTAIVASNTSSLSITTLGEEIGASERIVGTHYWNPPLLMPLVEVIRGAHTAPEVISRVVAELTALGKRPVLVERDVPGFVWNRLQLAMLREAVWIVEHGVATPETVDEIIRDGLARRWRYTGPFQTAALGGPATFERVANNLWPVLSTAERLANLQHWLNEDATTLTRWRTARDAGLREELQRERRPSPGNEAT